MLTSDQTGERLGDIQIKMEKAKRILTEINEDYDMIRADRYDKWIRELYSSDSNLQDSLMSLTDAIMYIKHEMNGLECVVEWHQYTISNGYMSPKIHSSGGRGGYLDE